MPLLFELSRPLDDLEGMLLSSFAGQSKSMRQIYQDHSVDRPYVAKHYKKVLAKLEGEEKIGVTDPKNTKHRRGFADHLIVHFPGTP